ncbi:MAG: hypothetical protein K2M91_10255 [Lachnospiraceae bacterium]|nr:hypothetical protein [Lachnospiraceae bacterium]
MSTLEKTISLLNALPEKQIETIYSFVQFLSSQQTVERPAVTESLDDIFGNIIGTVPDTGKSLEEYREERIRERYEAVN